MRKNNKNFLKVSVFLVIAYTSFSALINMTRTENIHHFYKSVPKKTHQKLVYYFY